MVFVSWLIIDHWIVLATKDLACVTQEIPHGTIEISKK
jgi:hypothetical protein